MKLRHSACLATIVALSAWSLAACSSDETKVSDDGGSQEGGGSGGKGNGGSGAKAGSSGSSGSAGKAGGGGTSGSAGSAGSAGKAGSAGTPGVDGGNDGGLPSITITSPADNAAIKLTTAAGGEDVSVAFTVQNFTLKDGTANCPKNTCGHVHLLVDGPACNAPSGTGKLPYNAFGAASPLTAGLAHCPNAAGTHTIVVELHNADHTPVLGVDGKVISDEISILASFAGDGGGGDGGGTKPDGG